MKRPRAGCPGGALAAAGDVAPRIDPQAVRWPRPQLRWGCRCLSHSISTVVAIWWRRQVVLPSRHCALTPASATRPESRVQAAARQPPARAVAGAAGAAAASVRSHARSQPRRAADRLRQGDAARSLPARRAKATRTCSRACRCAYRRRRRRMRSGSTTTCRGSGSCRRRRSCRNGGTERGLPISCFLNAVDGFARRHRRHLDRERVARLERRRHRHLLGRRALDRRDGEAAARPRASFRSSASWTR